MQRLQSPLVLPEEVFKKFGVLNNLVFKLGLDEAKVAVCVVELIWFASLKNYDLVLKCPKLFKQDELRLLLILTVLYFVCIDALFIDLSHRSCQVVDYDARIELAIVVQTDRGSVSGTLGEDSFSDFN